MEQVINLATIANGALAEQANAEIQNVIDNIADPNTSEKAKRKVTIVLEFVPNGNRTVADISIQAKATVAPVKSIATSIVIDKDLKTGQVKAAEIGNQIAGQMEIEPEEVKQDGVIDLKKAKIN